MCSYDVMFCWMWVGKTTWYGVEEVEELACGVTMRPARKGFSDPDIKYLNNDMAKPSAMYLMLQAPGKVLKKDMIDAGSLP